MNGKAGSIAGFLRRKQFRNETDTSRRDLAARGDSSRREVVGEVSGIVSVLV
ncbi:MAG: hypothetical protein AAB629_01355 [Patescibacteria group bacterium]